MTNSTNLWDPWKVINMATTTGGFPQSTSVPYWDDQSSYWTNATNTVTFQTPVENDITLRRPGKPDLKLGEAIDQIMDRLAIITADEEKMKKYPALREAYDHYKLIEAMIANDDTEDDGTV